MVGLEPSHGGNQALAHDPLDPDYGLFRPRSVKHADLRAGDAAIDLPAQAVERGRPCRGRPSDRHVVLGLVKRSIGHVLSTLRPADLSINEQIRGNREAILQRLANCQKDQFAALVMKPARGHRIGGRS